MLITNRKSHFDWYQNRPLKGIITLFCIILLNSVAFGAHYVKVVD